MRSQAKTYRCRLKRKIVSEFGEPKTNLGEECRLDVSRDHGLKDVPQLENRVVISTSTTAPRGQSPSEVCRGASSS